MLITHMENTTILECCIYLKGDIYEQFTRI